MGGVVRTTDGSTESRPIDVAFLQWVTCELQRLEEKRLFGRLERLRYVDWGHVFSILTIKQGARLGVLRLAKLLGLREWTGASGGERKAAGRCCYFWDGTP